MNSLNLIPIFMLGLLGSVHCIGMCGGIVGALSMVPSGAQPLHVNVSTVRNAAFLRTISYNLGRITSYVVAGAFVGGLVNGLVGGVRALTEISAWQNVAYLLTNLMLIALGLYLMNIWRGLTQLEVIGQRLWQKVKPLTTFLLPLDTPFKLLLAGSIWGWLPCSMVYSVLLTAMLSGTAASGAAVMLAFGLGTLPMLLAIGVFGAQIRHFLQRRAVRLTSGAIVIGFGVLGLMRASHGLPINWLDAFCI